MHAWGNNRTLFWITLMSIWGEEVKIEELAGMAALSPFYFQRLFKRLVHKPVQEYVKLRRLAKAVEAPVLPQVKPPHGRRKPQLPLYRVVIHGQRPGVAGAEALLSKSDGGRGHIGKGHSAVALQQDLQRLQQAGDGHGLPPPDPSTRPVPRRLL